MATTVVIDHFTGAPDANIDGRTPDGFIGFPPETPDTDPDKVCLDVGEWSRVQYSPSTGTFDLLANIFTGSVGPSVGGNNSASLVVEVPPHVSGQLLLLVVYSRNGTARLPTTPTGFTTGKSANGTSVQGALLAAYRVADGTETSTYTVTFTGAGAANVSQVAQMIALNSPTGSPLGVVGATATWLSASTLGPVTGITPTASPSLVFLIAAKQNDFRQQDTLATDSGTWSRLMEPEETAGDDAAFCVFAQYQSSGSAVSSTSVTDNGPTGSSQAGAGIGFMLEFLVSAAPTIHECRHSAIPSADGNWNHYVIKDLVLSNDHMVEASFTPWEYNQIEWVAVLARHDPVYEIGFEFEAQIFDDGTVLWFLFRVDPPSPATGPGNYVELASGFTSVTAYDPILLQLCVEGGVGDVTLNAWINTEQVVTDVNDPSTSHTALWPMDADPSWPGVCMSDLSRTGRAVQCNYVLADPTCGGEYPDSCGDPCEGDPDGPNPYPYPPPPVQPIFGIWGEKRGDWRQASLTQIDPVQAFGLGANRRMVLGSVMYQGAWRDILSSESTGDPDTPGDPYPPYYDPCEILPPTDTPPDVIIGAPPDRLFFAWGISTSQLGPLWTATFMAMGSSITTGISQAAARGGAVFGTPGDKTKFFTGGAYDPDKMDAWIASLSPFMPTVLAAQSAGTFAGVHTADDWENSLKWPPIGLPLTEINRIAGVWKTLYPGIRVMLRARTGQIGGTSLPNIDGIISQMRSRGAEFDAVGRDAGNYAEGELDYCQARGWILHLSNNVYEGAANGVTLTAAQVLADGLAWVDVVGSHPHGGAVYGMGIWQFAPRNAQNATGPDYLNAYAAWRNALATLGPPTFP